MLRGSNLSRAPVLARSTFWRSRLKSSNLQGMPRAFNLSRPLVLVRSAFWRSRLKMFQVASSGSEQTANVIGRRTGPSRFTLRADQAKRENGRSLTAFHVSKQDSDFYGFFSSRSQLTLLFDPPPNPPSLCLWWWWRKGSPRARSESGAPSSPSSMEASPACSLPASSSPSIWSRYAAGLRYHLSDLMCCCYYPSRYGHVSFSLSVPNCVSLGSKIFFIGFSGFKGNAVFLAVLDAKKMNVFMRFHDDLLLDLRSVLG